MSKRANTRDVAKAILNFNQRQNAVDAHCTIATEYHCHDKKTGDCIPFIKCCETHWANCNDGCHSECACQDFEG